MTSAEPKARDFDQPKAEPRMASHDDDDDDDDMRSSADSTETQRGVKRVEAVSQTWTKWGLVWAYVGLFLMAFVTSLDGQTVLSLSIYATSSFSQHSMLAIILVVQGIVNAVLKTPVAKIADFFGRLESFCVSVTFYILGYIQMAASKNIRSYAAGQIFYSAGITGLEVLQQIFIADTSDLLNRTLLATLTNVPFLATIWIGPPLADSILSHGTSAWRWGYGIWAIVLPVAFLPLASSLFVNTRRAARLGRLPPPPWKGHTAGSFLWRLFRDLDVVGLLLLSAALSLILLPLSLAAGARGGWRNPSIIAMLVVGGTSAIAFFLVESSRRISPSPVLPLKLMRRRTVWAGCALAFFYFMVFYLSVQPYFNSYVQVVHNRSVTAAGHITQVFSFASTVSAIIVSLGIKYSARYKYFVVLGACVYITAIGLMILYRNAESSTGQLVGTQICLGIGGGMMAWPTQLGVQASASHQEVAAVTAIYLTLLEIGGAVGAAISGRVWTSNIPTKLEAYLPDSAKGEAQLIFGSLTKALEYPMGSPERIAINRAYEETIHKLLIIAICLAVPLIPLSLALSNYRLDEMDQRVQGMVVGSSRRRSIGWRGFRRQSNERVPSSADSPA